MNSPTIRSAAEALAVALLLAVSAPAWAGSPGAVPEGVVVGEAFLDDWTVVAARPGFAGSLRLVLARSSTHARIEVDVVRRGDAPRAPVWSDDLELFVMDGGDGDRQTDPELVAALQVLLEQLGDPAGQKRLAASLLTHDERFERYPRILRRGRRA